MRIWIVNLFSPTGQVVFASKGWNNRSQKSREIWVRIGQQASPCRYTHDTFNVLPCMALRQGSYRVEPAMSAELSPITCFFCVSELWRQLKLACPV